MSTIEKAVDHLNKGSASPKVGVGHTAAVPPVSVNQNSDPLSASDSSSGAGSASIRARLEAKNMLTPGVGINQTVEEYRRIKRPLLTNIDGKKGIVSEHPNLIAVTSSMPGEGKTFNSVNLAMSIAMEMDRTVLFVDADVHKPAASTLLGVVERKGLTDVLASDSLVLSDVLIKTDIPKLTLLSVGCHRENANELLASNAMVNLMNELAHRYQDRVVIIDTPPLLVTNEAVILANLAGQVVVVVEAEETLHSVLDEALSSLDVEGKSVGLVLNKSRIASSKDSYYGGYPGRYPGQ